MATRKRRIKKKPVWERGYRWEAATYAGRSGTLKDAKRAVEEAVLLGTVQLPLFDPPQRE